MSRRLGYRILNVNERKNSNVKNSRKNSKLKPKTQGFDIFLLPTCRKNGQKTSLTYLEKSNILLNKESRCLLEQKEGSCDNT